MSYDEIPKIGIFSLSSCEGCIVEILTLGNDFFNLLNYVQVSDCRILGIKDNGNIIDISFVEGAVMSSWDEEKIRSIRDRSRILVAIGDCAATGGRFIFRDFDMEEINKELPRMGKYRAYPISKYVNVDYYIYGCPITKEEFKFILKDILLKRKPSGYKDVCSECPRYYNCLIDENKPCLGSITRSGCGAYCPSNARECFGCRGLYEDANIEGLIEILREKNIRIPPHLINLLKVRQHVK